MVDVRRLSPQLTAYGPDRSARVTALVAGHAGAAVHWARGLVDSVPSDWRVWAMNWRPYAESQRTRLPAQHEAAGLEGLAALISEELAELLDTSDVLVFYGQSIGARLALAVAHQVQQGHNLTTAALVVWGYPAPCQAISACLPPSDEELAKQLVELGATSTEVMADQRLWNRVMQQIRADTNFIEAGASQYNSLQVSIPLLAGRGTADPWVTPSDVSAWSGHTRATFRQLEAPGGHLPDAGASFLWRAVADELQFRYNSGFG